ncbi:Pollen preferential protein [Heracleum sosnowskyi]|uniref:Pollen preferential protein n=1 Tax=Heracleum sosnowskyi TaxID=360622 RepID=A0AAD8J462_9APIA|nr:Pollen preferential protein [Heracleum sosnowskyi]KAK1397314.1 Pollen preferential protein [Heracleum sosnowskyi]
MTVLDSPPLDKNLSLLRSSSRNTNPSSRKRFIEVAGGATAECAAVTCCCPCSLLNLLVLVMYKVPAGLFRKALRHKRRRRIMKKEGLLPAPGLGKSNAKEAEIGTVLSGDSVMMVKALEKNEDVMEVLEKDDGMMKLDKEMWEQFYQTGFWRSPSQRLVTFTR